MTNERYVRVEIAGGIATVRIGDPNDDRFVAERHPMHRELRDVWPRLAEEDAVAAAVVTGTHGQFCPAPSLANLDALLAARADAALRLQLEAREIFRNLAAFRKPLVAAVAGAAYGIGAQVALLSDFVVADRAATFQDTHVRLGLTAGDGGTVVWPLVLGLARARELLLRGHPLNAEEAHELGLIAELVDSADAVLPVAQDLAGRLGELPTTAYATTKLALNRWLELGADVSLEMAAAHQVGSYESDEFKARRRAERERRKT